ncbi:MAG: glycine oxidase [Solirubrobacteraceae bacterium]|jgi:glycine oxidase|nr:glycine oxidase [Solirubrobacteraceae bacterium]
MEIVVAGAGVIGLAVARELAGGGARVTVLERCRAGRGATWAAAGILSPTDPHEWGGALGAFNAGAIATWPGWQAELAGETGLDTGFEQRGELRVGPPGERFVAATRDGARLAGWACEELDADALRAAEPGLAADGLEGLRLPDTAGVRTDALTAALLASCRARGVRLREGCAVTALERQAAVLAGGERVRFERFVLATGAWSSAWAGDLVRPVVRPVLGESVVLRADGICALPVRSSRGSVVPARDGTYHVGTTVRELGFQDAPSVASVRRLLDNATRLFPALDDALLVGARSGLRPMSADGFPIMGPVDGGVVLATGHGREGIIHAPATARLIAAGILGGEWDAIPAAFRPSAER